MSRPSILSRHEWDAQPFRGTPQPMGVEEIVLHHSAGAGDNGSRGDFISSVRGIQRLHQSTRVSDGPWDDIGYHFLVGRGGHIAQGRPKSGNRYVRGAHVGVYNTGRLGVCLLGYFHEPRNDRLKGAQREALINLLRWLCKSNDLSASAIKMHKDFDATACPGETIVAQIEEIRRDVAKGGEPSMEEEAGEALSQIESGASRLRRLLTNG